MLMNKKSKEVKLKIKLSVDGYSYLIKLKTKIRDLNLAAFDKYYKTKTIW